MLLLLRHWRASRHYPIQLVQYPRRVLLDPKSDGCSYQKSDATSNYCCADHSTAHGKSYNAKTDTTANACADSVTDSTANACADSVTDSTANACADSRSIPCGLCRDDGFCRNQVVQQLPFQRK